MESCNKCLSVKYPFYGVAFHFPNTLEWVSSMSSNYDSSLSNEELKERFQRQMQLQYSQNVLETVTEKCFNKCIIHPSSTLSTNDKECLQRCMDRFVEAMNLVGKTLAEKSS